MDGTHALRTMPTAILLLDLALLGKLALVSFDVLLWNVWGMNPNDSTNQ